jgi:hypothetical protein
MQDSGNKLTVSVYRHPDQFPPEVQQFFANAPASNVECSVPWYRNMVNAVFKDNDAVCFYVVSDQHRPVAALPIVVKRTTFGGHTIEALANYYTSLYAPTLAAQSDVQWLTYLMRAVKTEYAPVISLRFAPMDPDGVGFRTLLASLQANGLFSFEFFSFGNWYQPVTDDWSTYLKKREGTVRSTIKRMGKKFVAENGELELFCVGADLDRGIAAYQHVYALSWKQAEPYPDFVPGLIRACAAQGWLRLGVAWLNDKPIAAQIWIIFNGKASIYKLAYDESFKSYAPGTLLTAMLMERAIEVDKVQEIDYLIGDDPYKKAWMSHRRERWGIVSYNPRTLRGFLGLSKEVLGRTIKTVFVRISTASHAITK